MNMNQADITKGCNTIDLMSYREMERWNTIVISLLQSFRMLGLLL